MIRRRRLVAAILASVAARAWAGQAAIAQQRRPGPTFDAATFAAHTRFLSSDLLEVLGLSDRVLVMRQGGLAGEFAAAQASEENVIACAAGVGFQE